MFVKRLGREGQMQLLRTIGDPKGHGLTDRDVDRQLFTFCLNCPDPCGAMDLITDAPRGTTDAEILDQALAMPIRDVATWSDAELSMDHPLRHWVIEA